MQKKNIIFLSISLILIILLGIGVSYSMWNITVSQDEVNTAMTKCFDITYSSESNAINLEKQYPISDEAGSKLTPYTFKITNTCDINAYYKINLETLNSSNIDTKFIKASLNNDSSKVISDYSETSVSLRDGKVANNLKSGYLPVGGSISFDLRLWIDYDTTVNDIKNDGTDKWIGKIVVVLSPVTEDEINKVCQNSGGDLIDSGECRKYYVKLNQQFNVNNVLTYSYDYQINDNKSNSFSLVTNGSNARFGPVLTYTENNLYFICFYSENTGEFTSARTHGADEYPLRATKYTRKNEDNYYYYNFYNDYNSYIIIPDINAWSAWYFEWVDVNFLKYQTIDLTLMFGEGNEPDKEWCDKYLNNYYEYNLEGTLTPIKELGEPIKTSYYDKIDMFD